MGNDYITLTKAGREKIVKELEFLKTTKRHEVAKALNEARSHGDLSENAEYDAAKEMQALNEKKIGEIEAILMRSRIIDDSAIAKDEALLGATIKVKDLEMDEIFDYMLVSEEEADFEENKISISSPVGRAILGKRVGEIAEVNLQAGIIKYEILEINR